LVEERESRILIAGGGTGGHLFPALAVAGELRRRRPEAAITFVGGRDGLETRLVPEAGYELRTLPLSGMKGARLARGAIAAGAAGWGVVRCAIWMARRRPDLVIGVGGYASGPAVLAAKLLGVPTMILEQNHFPGATNRWLAPHVDAVCVPSIHAKERLRGTGIVTGNPVRPEFARIGPPPSGPVLSLLVFGGSRGARSINRAMAEALAELTRAAEPPRIVHQTGESEETAVRDAYAAYPAGRSEVRAFLPDMPARLAAADLVLCRAGATTVAELAAAGRAAILVPYPFAADDHQTWNARSVEEAGGAEVLLDRDLTGPLLASRILSLASDPARRAAMGRAARSLAQPDAASRIADVAESLLPGGGRRVP
jgi:UDP-N-acetylglucosamine--N-acetylmuramyl-(pentapeptide) pyrophosphoryl-undecaprenol N-acetylglucosamine transferase